MSLVNRGVCNNRKGFWRYVIKDTLATVTSIFGNVYHYGRSAARRLDRYIVEAMFPRRPPRLPSVGSKCIDKLSAGWIARAPAYTA